MSKNDEQNFLSDSVFVRKKETHYMTEDFPPVLDLYAIPSACFLLGWTPGSASNTNQE